MTKIGAREKAWRHVLLAAINAGLDQDIFGLESDGGPQKASKYNFVIAGLPGIASASSIGYGEVAINAVVNPYDQWRERISVGNLFQFWAGDAVATG